MRTDKPVMDSAAVESTAAREAQGVFSTVAYLMEAGLSDDQAIKAVQKMKQLQISTSQMKPLIQKVQERGVPMQAFLTVLSSPEAEPGFIKSILAGGEQGTTLGWGDEARGALGQDPNVVRARDAIASAQHPSTYGAAKLAGISATAGIPAGGLARGLQAGGRLAPIVAEGIGGAVGGGVGGGLLAAGEAREGERAEQGMMGASIGGATGGLLGAASVPLGRLMGRFMTAASPRRQFNEEMGALVQDPNLRRAYMEMKGAGQTGSLAEVADNLGGLETVANMTPRSTVSASRAVGNMLDEANARLSLADQAYDQAFAAAPPVTITPQNIRRILRDYGAKQYMTHPMTPPLEFFKDVSKRMRRMLSGNSRAVDVSRKQVEADLDELINFIEAQGVPLRKLDTNYRIANEMLERAEKSAGRSTSAAGHGASARLVSGGQAVTAGFTPRGFFSNLIAPLQASREGVAQSASDIWRPAMLERLMGLKPPGNPATGFAGMLGSTGGTSLTGLLER